MHLIRCEDGEQFRTTSETKNNEILLPYIGRLLMLHIPDSNNQNSTLALICFGNFKKYLKPIKNYFKAYRSRYSQTL